DGLAGAAVAAVVIEFLKSGFSFYIGAMSSYQTVYGAIAAIPIFLLWMYVSWMAVLLGAVVAANLATWRVDERLAHLSTGGVRLAGRWRAHPLAPWQVQVAPAMERIVKAETAAMRVTLAELLADVRAPAARSLRAIAERFGAD